MLEHFELQSSIHTPKASIIWMHGLGADGNDFDTLVDELQLPESLPVRFVFPHAPIRPVSLNNGMEMRAWYDVYALDKNSLEDEAGMWESYQSIAELIEQEHLRGIPYDNIILGGFSQGAAIALFTGLRYSKTLGGIVALSGYLPAAKTLSAEETPMPSFPIFWGHGSEDLVVPMAWGKIGYDQLKQMNYSVEWHEYRMAHQLCMPEIADINAWLRKTLLP